MATTTAPSGFGRPIWNAIKGGNQVHGVGLIPVSVSFSPPATGTYSIPMFTAPASSAGGSWKVESASIVWAGGDVSGDGTNYWSFNLRAKQDTNSDGTVNRDQAMIGTATDLTTGTYREFDPISMDVDGPEAATPLNVFLEEGDTLSFDATDTGGGTVQNMSALTITVTALLRNSPPGR